MTNDNPALTAEVARAIAAVQAALQANIDTVTGNLAAEAAREIYAEAGLQGQISGILSNADPAALDSLTEIVSHFNASNLLDLLITVVKSHTDLLNTLLEPDLPAPRRSCLNPLGLI